jgi:hypothetical protein
VQGASATGHDSSTHTAALAKVARYTDDNAALIETAERGLQWALANGKRGPLQLSAALDLYAATGDEAHRTLAQELLAHLALDDVELVRAYDAAMATPGDAPDHVSALREGLVKKADAMLTLADNPFGVYTYGPAAKPNFFGTPPDPVGTPAAGGGWHIGTSSHILNAANLMALAYQCDPNPRYLAFVYDQFNWILGNNPYDISLMEGVGSSNPPTYHHRYAFSGVPRGSVPGSVVNGITWRGLGDDRPYFDMRALDIPDFEPNEVWLPHNTAYLKALANLNAARVHAD